jgi:hypothetical protein
VKCLAPFIRVRYTLFVSEESPIRLITAVSIFTLSVLSCQGAEIRILESTFNSGTDGWTTGEFFSGTHGTVPDVLTSGGVSGGYIETEDVYGFNSFHAPDSWLGNQTVLYGGFLTVSQRIQAADGLNYPLVVLAGGGTVLQYRTDPPAIGQDWTTYMIPFLAVAGWEIANGSGAPGPVATEEQLMAVLSGLQWFALDADWNTGPDRVGLDEVSVTISGDREIPNPNPEPMGIPEPSAFLLAGSGIGLLGFIARKRLIN